MENVSERDPNNVKKTLGRWPLPLGLGAASCGELLLGYTLHSTLYNCVCESELAAFYQMFNSAMLFKKSSKH